MLLLSELKLVRREAGLTAAQLAHLSGVPENRIRSFEITTRTKDRRPTEPWFHEAADIARVFGFAYVGRLVSLTNPLASCNLGKPLPQDVPMWLSGRPIALSVACRAALKLGFSDPLELAHPSMNTLRQIWSVVETSERLPGTPGCPWCLADTARGEPHAAHCLPAKLLCERSPRVAPNIISTASSAVLSQPLTGGARGWGLRTLRDELGFTQAQMALVLGSTSDSYAKLERGERNLTPDNARKFANHFGIPIERLYVKPPEAFTSV